MPPPPELEAGGAGGLSAANVREATAATGSSILGVDASSGLESSPGVKDQASIEAFVRGALTKADA